LFHTAEYDLRLPKRESDYQKILLLGTTNFEREVESERELPHVGVLFTKLPLFRFGQEPRLQNDATPVAYP